MTVNITQFKYEGAWGPFKIKSICEECNLTTSILKNMMEKEFKDKDVIFETKPWLSNWIYCFLKGCWHAPIIVVDGKKFYQFSEKQPLFNREELKNYVYKKVEEAQT